MKSHSIGQYRSHDSPKNFVVKVTLWKVVPGNVTPAGQYESKDLAESYEMSEKQSGVDFDKEEVFIHWQEKLFSEKEFNKFSDPLNCTTSLEQKYHEDILHLQSTGGGRPNRRVFTYVDSDLSKMIDDFDELIIGDDDAQTFLIDKMEHNYYTSQNKKHFGLRRRQLVTNKPSISVQSNRVIATPFKVMKILADVGEIDPEGNRIEEEQTLCAIKINANGLLVIQPDIELDEEIEFEVYQQNTRVIYRYKVQHVSQNISQREENQEELLFREIYTCHTNLVSTQVGGELFPIPHEKEHYVYTFCEIISAKNFEYDSLYVTFSMDLPSGWLSTSKCLSGASQSCSKNSAGTAHFSFPVEFQLSYSWTSEQTMNWPTLYLQVYSLDSWQRHRVEGYGYCQLPNIAGTSTVEVDMWIPKGNSQINEMRRFFIGGSSELEDAFYVKDEKLNRFNFKTTTTGTLTLKWNTLFQTKIDDMNEHVDGRVSKWKKVSQKTSKVSVIVDSLTQVLDAFYLARKRMLDARSALPTT